MGGGELTWKRCWAVIYWAYNGKGPGESAVERHQHGTRPPVRDLSPQFPTTQGKALGHHPAQISGCLSQRCGKHACDLCTDLEQKSLSPRGRGGNAAQRAGHTTQTYSELETHSGNGPTRLLAPLRRRIAHAHAYHIVWLLNIQPRNNGGHSDGNRIPIILAQLRFSSEQPDACSGQ